MDNSTTLQLTVRAAQFCDGERALVIQVGTAAFLGEGGGDRGPEGQNFEVFAGMHPYVFKCGCGLCSVALK